MPITQDYTELHLVGCCAKRYEKIAKCWHSSHRREDSSVGTLERLLNVLAKSIGIYCVYLGALLDCRVGRPVNMISSFAIKTQMM